VLEGSEGERKGEVTNEKLGDFRVLFFVLSGVRHVRTLILPFLVAHTTPPHAFLFTYMQTMHRMVKSSPSCSAKCVLIMYFFSHTKSARDSQE